MDLTSLTNETASADAERQAWIFLNHVPYLGPMRFQRLLLAARSAVSILRMTALELTQAEVGPDLAAHWRSCFDDPKQWAGVERELAAESRGEFRIVTELDAGYPDDLRNVIDRPPVVYVKGVWPPPEGRRIGIVGTRRATPYGLQMAEYVARECAVQQIATVSGLAAGIDTVAHRTTLAYGGYTVAVLGHGLAHRFPRGNRRLFEAIAEKGALITEFPVAMPPQAVHFPRRNRIISGLSSVVVVIEAGEKSGALITARYAAEQGRDVYAVPGRLFQDESAGCHRLIKEGATLLTGMEDVLGPKALDAVAAPLVQGTLTDEERTLLTMLKEPITVDDIIERMGGSVDHWLASLLSLELQKLITVYPGQRYGRNI